MRRLMLGTACAVLALASPVAARAASGPLGQERPARAAIATPSGKARAVASRARSAAVLARMRVFLDARSRATRVTVGLYADRRGHPGRLLAKGGRSGRRLRGWVEVRLPATRIVAGRRYWLAVLGRGGMLRSRAARATCPSEVSRSRGLRRLPTSWRTGKRSRRCGVTAIGLTASGAAGVTQPGATPVGDALAPGVALRSPAQAVVDAARAAPFIRYGRGYPGGANTSDGWGGGASMVLATAAYAGNTTADARLLAQMRDTIAGGNEPVANGGYPAQHERWVTAMFALARHTPRIWNQLSAEERHRIDLVMTGALVASAFTTSDRNPYVQAGTQQVTLDGDTDVNRDWNPNYREGMVGMMVVGDAYFGSGAAAQAVLDAWSQGAFVAELKAAGLTNMADTFTWKADHPSSAAPSAATIEQAVRGYRYYGLDLGQPMAMARTLTQNTYNANVVCGLNGGAGIPTSDGAAGAIVSGCDGLANKGAVGMLQELDGVDGSGPRSSALYGYDGFRTNQNNQLALLASGLWQAGADADAIVARLRIGAPDLWYKLARGYRGYASGSLQYIPDAPSPGVLRDDNANFSFPFSRSLWEDVVRPAFGL